MYIVKGVLTHEKDLQQDLLVFIVFGLEHLLELSIKLTIKNMKEIIIPYLKSCPEFMVVYMDNFDNDEKSFINTIKQ